MCSPTSTQIYPSHLGATNTKLGTNLVKTIHHSCCLVTPEKVSCMPWGSNDWAVVQRVSILAYSLLFCWYQRMWRGGDCHGATDWNFHQRHLKKARDGTYFYNQYFISKEQIDVTGKKIEKAHRCPPHLYKSKVPDAVLNQCDDSHTVGSSNKVKTGDLFNEKGMGALVCCHDIPLFFVNIDTLGEQQEYAVGLINHIFSMLPPNAMVVVLYNIGCVLDHSIHKVSHFLIWSSHHRLI